MGVYGNCFTCHLNYWPSFLGGHAENVASTFATAVYRVLDNPSLTLNEVNLLNEQHTSKILAWNQAAPVALDACVPDLFAQFVHEQPEAQAIYAWDGIFTYRELDQLSTRLANYLVSLGVGPEVSVPLCFEKSAWAKVAMLAVLKAGGAFVPLDPAHPPQRLENIIQSVDAKILLVSAEQANLGLCPTVRSVVVSASDMKQWSSASVPSSTNNILRPSNAAYIIFTSGTTGTPKGIVIPHSAFCSSAMAHGNIIGISRSSRVLQFASYAFDASILEILTTLVHGGTVCVPSSHHKLDDIVGFISMAQVNWMFTTPSLSTTVDPASIPGLKTMAIGGESLTKSALDRWADKLHLIQCYGPSETTIICLIRTHMAKSTEPTDIGKAAGGIMWIAHPKDHNRLMPIGCAGELLIEGPILARGYLDDPQKTAAAFIENPTWAASGSARRRFYKSGDLVRYGSDGSIHFIGRKDTQVKIRGNRVEIDEIEHHLMAHSTTLHSIMLTPTFGQGGRRLVGVIVPSSRPEHAQSHMLDGIEAFHGKEKDQLVSEWADFLHDRVPVYMIPEGWLVINELPMSTSAKADRKALTKWIEGLEMETYDKLAYSTSDSTGDDHEPRTDTEFKVRQILSRVLNTAEQRIGMDRSFLSMGGDSISAMQVAFNCRMDNITIKTQDILRGKTIRELAANAVPIKQGQATQYEEEVDVPFGLSPIQKMYFELFETPSNLTNDHTGAYRFNQSFLLRLMKHVEPQNIVLGIEAIVGRYSMLRARFQQDGNGSWTQRITSQIAGSYRFHMNGVSSQQDIESAVSRAQASLDMENGPIFSVDLMHRDNEDQLLFLVAHHAVIDLVSWRALMEDLELFITSGALSRAEPLSFQVWNKMQTKYAKEHLNPASVLLFDVPPINFDYWGMTGRPNIYQDVVRESFVLNEELTTKLFSADCQRAMSTEPIDILLAGVTYAFQSVFPDRPQPTIFREGHGREPWDNSIDITSTLGWFTIIFPVRAETDEKPGIVELIGKMKDMRRRMPGKGYSYFTSRYLNDDGIAAFSSHMPHEITFDYVGRYQQLERDDALFRQERVRPLQSTVDEGPLMTRFTLFEITVDILDGQLQFVLAYNRLSLHQENIVRWVTACQDSIIEAIDLLQSREIGYTPSDFSHPHLTDVALEFLSGSALKELGASSLSEVEDIYPCSPAQEGMLISQMKSPDVYRVHLIYEACASDPTTLIDVERLCRSWKKVVDRHGALRTVFVPSNSPGGIFDQVLLKNAAPNVKYISTSHGDAVRALNEIQTDVTARFGHRLTICQTPQKTVFFRLDLNHAITDGASNEVILRDLSLAYGDALEDAKGPSHCEFVILQRRAMETARHFWEAYLKGASPCHFPVLNDGKPGEATLRCADINLKVDYAAMRNLCEQTNITVATLFHVAWAVTLWLYTGDEDVCFGYLASGRDLPIQNIEDGVGAYLNTMVSRLKISSVATVVEALHQVQGDVTESLENQHYSLLEMQHMLRLGGERLFNTGISFQTHTSKDLGDESALMFRFQTMNDPTEVNTPCTAAFRLHIPSIYRRLSRSKLTKLQSTKLQ